MSELDTFENEGGVIVNTEPPDKSIGVSILHVGNEQSSALNPDKPAPTSNVIEDRRFKASDEPRASDVSDKSAGKQGGT